MVKRRTRIVRGLGLNPIAHLNDPHSSGKFQPLGGRCNPLAHYHSLSMNGLFIITRPPSTTMHCIPCVRSFGHLLVIKINYSAKQSTEICLCKICTAPFHRGIKEGPLPNPHTVCVPRLDLLTSYGARPGFWTIRALVKSETKFENGRIQRLPKFFGYPLLSRERVKLRASNLAGTFIGSI